jgi:hypothetical protein
LTLTGGISKLRDAKTTKIQNRTVNQQAAYHLRMPQSQTIKLKKLFEEYNISDTIKLPKIVERKLSNHSNK